MSTFQKAYKALLQGVSQQLPAERLPGQVSEQTNMLSDPTTQLRRRPGCKVVKAFASTSDTDHLAVWPTQIGGVKMRVVVNALNGSVQGIDDAYNTLFTLASPYLIAANVQDLRAAAVGNEFFLCNRSKRPTPTYNGTEEDPEFRGFFYIVAGAFNREYTVYVEANTTSTTQSYKTPSGSGTNDADLATPTYIAQQLANKIQAAMPGMTVTQSGPYVVLRGNSVPTQGIAVSSQDGSAYIQTSNRHQVPSVGALPARLPLAGNGFIVGVGSGTSLTYYKYNADTVQWLEVGAYGSPATITNVPISLLYDGTNFVLNSSPFEGRLAGDEGSNPMFEFVSQGITGMGTYQGRLVLLSGPLVALSASTRPRRFFRSTVTSVLASDPIEIGSSMNSAASYEWATSFQKDLILHSSAYQAVIPSGNQALTAANALVVPTSSFSTDVTSAPISLGRTLMYCAPRSEDYFGVLEMLPSQYTDSQYVSQDATPHLPRYMRGRCRFAVSSSVASIAVFGSTTEKNVMVVHEYHWSGDEKQQQAWHRWEFPYDIATAYFAGDFIELVFIRNGMAVIAQIDPRAGSANPAGERRPMLDMNVSLPIVANVITPPAWMATFDPTMLARLQVVAGTGPLAGDRVGTSVEGATLRTVRSWASGTVGVGLPYTSSVTPSPPQVTDFQGAVVHGDKATLLRFLLGTMNSTDFKVQVDDQHSAGEEYDVSALYYDSAELALGRADYNEAEAHLVDCRTDMRTTQMRVFTDGTGELNLTFLEYVGKYNPKITRR